MTNPIYVGLSRQNALRQAIDVVANNIANVNTTGYKADKTRFIEYIERTQRGENISFARNHSAYRDSRAGHLERTGGKLDIGFADQGFIAVQTPAGERYTRDGRMRLNTFGALTTNDGHVIKGLDTNSITIEPNATDISIDQAGIVSYQTQAGERVFAGQILTVSFENPSELQKQGSSLLMAGEQVPIIIDEPNLRQGYIEKSNVNAVSELTSLISLQRSHDSVSKILRDENEREEQMIRRLTSRQG